MVTAQETTLQDVLEGTKQYIVPLYQRPYQWGKKQLQELWDDIVELTDDRREGTRRSHFIGSLVLAPPPVAIAGGVTTYLVVDGQQRLTTLSLLLAAIRDYRISTEGDNEAGAEIDAQYLVNQFKKGSQHIKFMPTQADRNSYNAVIRRLPGAGGADTIGEAYRFFRTRLEQFDDPEDPHDITALQEAIVEGLSLVSISTHPDDNVHRIFQSLNKTGLKLTQGDLLRNYIFMRLPENGDDAYERYWHPLQQRLSNDQIESLFWIDLIQRNQNAKVNDTFVLQQKRMDKLETEEEILADLARFAELSELYKLILEPNLEKNPRVQHRLRRLDEWSVTTPHPLVLELLKWRSDGKTSDDELADALHIIESYLVRRFLGGRATQGLNRTFREAVAILDENEPVDIQLRRWLSTGRKHFHTDDEMREAIKTQPFYLNGRRAHRQLFLRWLETEYGSREPVDTSELTIEHVMPQTLSSDWRNFLISEYPDAEVEMLHDTRKHTLGNLTLTGYNTQMSNKPFAWKRGEMQRSGLRLSSSITEQEQWGPNEIDARADVLADLITSSWVGPMASSEVADNVNPKWTKLRQILLALPAGRWTSYGEIASVIGSAAQPVGNYIANTEVENAYRVLRSTGEVPAGFRWYNEDDDRDPQELLASEGLEFSAQGRASTEQFLDAEALADLIADEDNGDD